MLENLGWLRQLKDEELLEKLKSLAAKERELTTMILRHLQEVERRRLFAARGFPSLFEYCTQELGYSAASAQRRIASMRLLKTLPEIEDKISSGSLNLSNVAQAAQFFQNEEKNNKPLTIADKKEILQQLEGKSSREVQRELAGRSSNPIAFLKQDRIRPITPTYSEVRFVADQRLLDNLEKVKGLLAHRMENLTTAELIAELTRIAIESLESKKFAQRTSKAEKNTPHTSDVGSKISEPQTLTDLQPENTRYITADIKRAVYRRDAGQCTFVDPVTGKRCESKYKIEFEHLKPYALGGKNDEANVTLRCRTHNLWSAVQAFGEKTQSYLKQ